MGVAKDIQRLMSERGDASLEFAGDGYNLSLNPIEGRFHEIGFILWADDGGGLAPVATGRAVGDDLVFDGDAPPGNAAAVIAALLEGEPVSALGGGGNESAIPTGG